MTLQSRKKRRTTPPNTPRATSRRRTCHARLACCAALLLCLSDDALGLSGDAASANAGLKWGRPQFAGRTVSREMVAQPTVVKKDSVKKNWVQKDLVQKNRVQKTYAAPSLQQSTKQPTRAAANRRLVAQPAFTARPTFTAQPTSTLVIRDPRVVGVAWQDDALDQPSPTTAPASVDAEPAEVYDPFEADDALLADDAPFADDAPVEDDSPFADDAAAGGRLAQLADDPFDEPTAESLPDPSLPDPSTSDPSLPDAQQPTDIDSIDAAIEQEIERRRSQDDLPGEEKSIDDLLDDPELFSDEEDPADKLQLDREDWQTPDLDEAQDRADQDEPLSAEELEEQGKELEQERSESEAGCREELAEIEADRISSIDLSIHVEGNAGEDYPYECKLGNSLHQPRHWPQITYHWKAAALCHQPLYFEQVQLERYGHSWGPYVQPIMSGVHFFGTLPVLPYKMGIRTPTECVYTLGYYRPGSCAPYLLEPIPFTWRAALFQTGAATGISFVVP